MIGWLCISKACVGRNPMTLVVGLVVVPHHMDIIPWALLEGVHGGASVIRLNSMNLGVRVHGGAPT